MTCKNSVLMPLYIHIPFTNLTGRPLYKYLMKDVKKKKIGYRLPEGKQIFVQTVLNGYE